MKLNNRITLYMAVLVVLAMILLPYANAQIPGSSGQRGGVGGRGGRSGDMDMGPSGLYDRGGDRDRGGPGPWMDGGSGPWMDDGYGPWMDRENLSDFQISLILKAYSTRNPTESKNLQDQRKDMSREAFIQTLISPRYAFSEYLRVMSDERHYTTILNWCEKWVADEAKGIKETKEENYDLYKKRIDTLENRYSPIIYTNNIEELIPVLVKDLQLNTRQNDLVWQIRTADNQTKKDSLKASLRGVVSELYDLNIQQRIIQLKQIQNQIDRLQQNLQFEMNQIEIIKDPNVAQEAIDLRVDGLTSGRGGFMGGSMRGGRGGGRGNRPPQFSTSDVNDQNRNPAP